MEIQAKQEDRCELRKNSSILSYYIRRGIRRTVGRSCARLDFKISGQSSILECPDFELKTYSNSLLRLLKSRRLWAAALLGSISCPTLAQDTKSTVAALSDEKAIVAARTELQTAETNLAKARLDALGLKPAEGTTETGANAGKIEAAMLSTSAVNRAAEYIAADVKAKAPGYRILLVGMDDQVDLGLPVALTEDLKRLQRSLTMAMSRSATLGPAAARACEVAPSAKKDRSAAPPIAAVGAVLSLLRTDTTITGLDVTPNASELVNAVAGRLDPPPVILADVGAATIDPALKKEIDILVERGGLALECRNALAARSRAADPHVTAQIAELDAGLANAQIFFGKLTERGEDGSTLLTRASRFAALSPADGKLRVLRVKIEHVGGTFLKRSNVWTALGAPAVGLTGGLVVSYRLSDPATGSIRASGLMYCWTALTNLRAVQSGRVRNSDCSYGR